MNKSLIRLRHSKSGALEGLPLYLIILVVIAAVSIVVVMGWMGTLQKSELDRIEYELKEDGKVVDTLEDGEKATVKVTAYDQNGKKLEDVTIKLEGAGQDTVKLTGSTGYASFTVTPELPTNVNNGVITITATYSGGNLNTPVTKEIVVTS